MTISRAQMYRQLYQLGGPIEEARSFFMNKQGLSPDQADMIVSQGLQAYNQQTQPQSMMQMASGGRIGYAFGKSVSAFTAQPGGSVGQARGIGGMMQKLIQQNPQMFRPVNNQQRLIAASSTRDFIDENENGIDDREEAAYGGRIGYQMGGTPTGIEPMAMDYGQPLQVPPQQQPNFSSAQNITMNPLENYGQPQLGSGTPLMMRGGGIARLGYQMGGEAMMQPQMGGEMGMQLGEGDNALLTIIQLLIEQGIDPEIAQQLARQILQIFAQGGEPAVEAFADQMEQQEEMEAMAAGGIAGYAQRRGYFVGKLVKSVGKSISKGIKSIGNAIKSVAKSPIGRIALTVGATMLMGPAGLNLAAGQFGVTNAFLAGAINAGAANLLVQGVTTGKINPKEALLSSVLGGATGYLNPASTGVPGSLSGDPSTISQGGLTPTELQNQAIVPIEQVKPVDVLPSVTTPNVSSNVGFGADTYGEFGKPTNITQSGMDLQRAYDAQSTLTQTKPGFIESIPGRIQTGIQSLYKDPIGTIKNLAGSAYDKIADNIVPLTTGAVLGKYVFGSPQQPDEPDDDFAKRQQEEANLSLTQFGRNLQIRNPYFYQRYGAENPFQTAANGGIMGYAAGGSMIPPARRIEGGIIELDARKSGGYIPYGKKERVDDVPAMLAKDEFVFTSRAVKAAGGGSARRGAAKMYKLMKQLESKGIKMERGARA